MSSLIVEIVKVDNIKKHPNADTLDIVIVKGWQVITKSKQIEIGDNVVYFQPDCMLRQKLAERLNITNYLSSNGRVKSIKLRQEASHGFIVNVNEFPELKKYKVGDNVAEILDVHKYEQIIPINSLLRGGNDTKLPDLPTFTRYTDIENFRNFNNILQDDEEVNVTEKIHGTNCRVGLVNGKWECGSHNVRRSVESSYFGELYWYIKKWLHWCYENKGFVKFRFKYTKNINNIYRYPLSLPGVKEMLEMVSRNMKATSIVLYGEIFGDVQDLKYGRKSGEYDFAAFDISVNGRYLDYGNFLLVCNKFNIPTVPLILEGSWSSFKDLLERISSGNTFVKDREGKDIKQIREGIVIKLKEERRDEKLGRVILKYISNDYYTRKGNLTEFK